MIDDIPNQPFYFYQKDIVDLIEIYLLVVICSLFGLVVLFFFLFEIYPLVVKHGLLENQP